MMKRLWVYLALLLAVTAGAAQDSYVFSSPEQTQRFYALLGELRCLVCQNQSLADSNATLAQDLRQEVYEQMQAGKDDVEISAYLVARYGDFVLYNPPFKASTAVLWLAPLLLLLIGLVVLFRFVKRCAP